MFDSEKTIFVNFPLLQFFISIKLYIFSKKKIRKKKKKKIRKTTFLSFTKESKRDIKKDHLYDVKARSGQ